MSSDGNGKERQTGKHESLILSEDEFWADITDEYVKGLSHMTPEEVYPSNNPGPTLPDGSINFECHCVGHLVASPCGYEFRQAISCQKSISPEEEEEGKCAEEFMAFMDCAIRTNCFKTNKDEDEENKASEEKSAKS